MGQERIIQFAVRPRLGKYDVTEGSTELIIVYSFLTSTTPEFNEQLCRFPPAAVDRSAVSIANRQIASAPPQEVEHDTVAFVEGAY